MIDLSKLPEPAVKNIAVRVKPAAERAIRQGHPWVFEESIVKQSHLGNAGDLAVIYDRDKNRFLAVGLYDPFSPIRIKILQREKPERINYAWFVKTLEAAQAQRQALIDTGITGYRLVYGESDKLPALVIDRYGDTLVMKLYTVAWLPQMKTLIAAMRKTLKFQNLVLRLSRALQSQRHDILRLHGLADGQVLLGAGNLTRAPFVENGLRFEADVRRGHKTGFFFDQRDNRQKARELANGRRILDVFAYSGGFSVYGLAGGAKSILALDSSEPALEALKANVALNGLDEKRVGVMVADAFAGLRELVDARRRFNLVIIDPPALANNRANVQKAVFAYRRLVELGLALLAEDGLLLMSSCSSRITMEMFYNLVTRSADAAGYELEITETTSHALDHPIGFPEAEYLKAIFAVLKS
ncbi:MAG: class I SAM-dependent rRNA methyltransferase [Chloroflexota bacterium]|nr:class I SAM-dependent rRNA methyltransferase [Chloroflexota bacterium]